MTDREHAFTMVELIVAMILLAVATALVVGGVMSGLRSSGAASAGSISDAAIARFSEQFVADVAGAETTDRIVGRVRDPFEFADAVRTGAAITSTEPATAGDRVDIYDVQQATSDTVVLMSDVLADRSEDPAVDPPAECVTWQVTRGGSPQHVTYTRTVRETCGGAVVDSRVILDMPADVDGVNDDPFSYQLQCNLTDCAPTGAPAGTARPCGTWTRSSVTGAKRAWIVGIQANVTTGTTQGRSAASSTQQQLIGIRSRTTSEYARALGC
ncbi:MAG: type II secretion system protein [Thermoleophilia bacterium]|nr:type II secretion system protein [Thermoleophilia bacterium]